MPTPKTKNAPTKRATTNRGASVGGIKTKSKKRFIFFSLIAVLVLAGVGYGGNYAYQKYQTKHQLASANSELKAHAASGWAALAQVAYTYGVITHNDSNYVQWACKRNGNTVSVLTARLNSRAAVVAAEVDVSGQNYAFTSDKDNAWASWWGNLNLQQIYMVRNGHNYLGYASANFSAEVDHDSYGTFIGDVGGPGSQYKGRWAYTNGYRGIRPSDLPACHY